MFRRLPSGVFPLPVLVWSLHGQQPAALAALVVLCFCRRRLFSFLPPSLGRCSALVAAWPPLPPPPCSAVLELALVFIGEVGRDFLLKVVPGVQDVMTE
ncbi:hypothetical protein AAHA92_33054 [Salvia divinorum]|uniref:Secreted protein n=1 Tax=Salvia divinorum TaxID=28513 RepID=A0ABD1FMR9_SALDI